MTEQSVVSVRATAHEWVRPDSATLYTDATATTDTREQARAAAGQVVAALTDELAGLAGLALAVDTRRHRLTWSVESTTTRPEVRQSAPRAEPEPTGRVVAVVTVAVVVRELDLVEPVVAALHAHPGLDLRAVRWAADEDNPAWPGVRALAIRAAVRQARDYAGALGGALGTVQHVADAGLLGGDGGGFAFTAQSASGSAGGMALDPVPQQLTATIDARFTVDGVALGGL